MDPRVENCFLFRWVDREMFSSFFSNFDDGSNLVHIMNFSNSKLVGDICDSFHCFDGRCNELCYIFAKKRPIFLMIS